MVVETRRKHAMMPSLLARVEFEVTTNAAHDSEKCASYREWDRCGAYMLFEV